MTSSSRWETMPSPTMAASPLARRHASSHLAPALLPPHPTVLHSSLRFTSPYLGRSACRSSTSSTSVTPASLSPSRSSEVVKSSHCVCLYSLCNASCRRLCTTSPSRIFCTEVCETPALPASINFSIPGLSHTAEGALPSPFLTDQTCFPLAVAAFPLDATGFAFVGLTEPYLHEWGDDWMSDAPQVCVRISPDNASRIRLVFTSVLSCSPAGSGSPGAHRRAAPVQRAAGQQSCHSQNEAYSARIHRIAQAAQPSRTLATQVILAKCFPSRRTAGYSHMADRQVSELYG